MAILVTDGGRIGVDIVRSLGKKGVDVDTAGVTRLSPSFFSKYCRDSMIYTSSEENFNKCISDLERIVKNKQYEMIIPATDLTIKPIITKRKLFEKYTKLPLPNNRVLNFAWSKSETLKFAKDIGIPIPKTFFVNNLRELKKIKNKIEYPIALKSESSNSLIKNKLHGIQVKYVNSYDELIFWFKKMYVGKKPPLIQEVIKGYGLGFFGLFNNSKPRAIFMHKRIREVSVDRGASTLRESIRDETIKKYGTKILEKLNWHGVAMVEFRMDEKDNTPKLMEINGRFWGSLALSIASGVDFPYLLYRMVTDGDIKPIFRYKTGVKCRWFSGDLYRLITFMTGKYNKQIFSESRIKSLIDFLKFFDKNLYYDLFCLDDPLPGFIDIINSVKKFIQKGI